MHKSISSDRIKTPYPDQKCTNLRPHKYWPFMASIACKESAVRLSSELGCLWPKFKLRLNGRSSYHIRSFKAVIVYKSITLHRTKMSTRRVHSNGERILPCSPQFLDRAYTLACCPLLLQTPRMYRTIVSHQPENEKPITSPITAIKGAFSENFLKMHLRIQVSYE